MLTLDVMDEIEMKPRPWGQLALAAGLLMPSYHKPWAKTTIRLEGREHLPAEPVIFAMNHTDRYNYWPFQYRIWRDDGRYTTTWVKGKYFNHPALRAFMIKTGNLAVPSRGYLITADAAQLLGEAPSSRVYRMLRDAVDAGETDTRPLRERAANEGVLSQMVPILDTPRDMLGHRFDPHQQTYLEAMEELFQAMMEKFVELNEQAIDVDLSVLVFPEGRRSVRLQDGKPGVAQMALRMGATVVPVGCNGSHEVYPGNSPVARGGEITYRLGAPLRPQEELAEFRIDEAFTPFTTEARERFGDRFEAMTDLIMERIEGLLDERHQPIEGHEEGTKGSDRFV